MKAPPPSKKNNKRKRENGAPAAQGNGSATMAPSQALKALEEAREHGLPKGRKMQWDMRVMKPTWITPDRSKKFPSLSKALEWIKKQEAKTKMPEVENPAPPTHVQKKRRRDSSPSSELNRSENPAERTNGIFIETSLLRDCMLAIGIEKANRTIWSLD